MTAIFVIAMLAAAGVLYSVCDNGSAMAARQMNEFNRVESKKFFRPTQAWY